MTSERHAIVLTAGAEDDISSIHAYIAETRSAASAVVFLDSMMEAVESLERFPHRGGVPRELERLGIVEFRQTVSGSYRLIYRIIASQVFILLIADGRRDLQSLLERRLLR